MSIPKNIDVIDLRSFEYLENLKNNTLPVSENNQVWYHCFVPKEVKENENEFVLMSFGETLLIRYDEKNKEFSYQTLSFLSSLRYCTSYAFVYWNHRIFIFGGYNIEQEKCIDSIWIYNIKEKSWKEYHSKMPFAISSAVCGK